MAQIKAADVAKLRTITGAGMMDCKQALEESNGNFDEAIDILRKKGQKVANKRADREAREGSVVGKTTADNKTAIMLTLNCETDFVAKNERFINLVNTVVDLAVEKLPNSLEELKNLPMNNQTVNENIIEQIGVIGEKLELSYYEKISGATTFAYNHPGNKLASIVAFNKENLDSQVVKDVAMQIAAMNPIAIDKDDISKETLQKELEIGKEQAINEGKSPEMAEKIAVGKLNKFYQESTLLNQQFVKDNKLTIRDYLKNTTKDATVTAFRRFSLSL